MDEHLPDELGATFESDVYKLDASQPIREAHECLNHFKNLDEHLVNQIVEYLIKFAINNRKSLKFIHDGPPEEILGPNPIKLEPPAN